MIQLMSLLIENTIDFLVFLQLYNCKPWTLT